MSIVTLWSYRNFGATHETGEVYLEATPANQSYAIVLIRFEQDAVTYSPECNVLRFSQLMFPKSFVSSNNAESKMRGRRSRCVLSAGIQL